MSEFSEYLVKLNDENQRLTQDLNFERNLNKILENIKNQSLVFIENCKCISNQNTLKVIKQFNSIYTDLKEKQNLLKLSQTEDQISIIKSKSNDKYDNNFETYSTNKGIQQKSVNPMKQNSRQTTEKGSKLKTCESKSDSNSSLRLISEIFNFKDKSNEDLSETPLVLSVNDLGDSRLSRQSIDFSCNLCKDCFTTEKDLKIHVNRDHENSLSFVCKECQQIFNSFVELSLHCSQTHPPNSSLNSFELKTNQKSKSKNKTKSNRVNRQTVLDLNCCGRCHQRFNSRQLLLNHSSIVHNIHVFECDLCVYKTERKQTLFRHKEAMHSADRPYKCPVIGCDKLFKTKHNISAHKKKVHFFLT